MRIITGQFHDTVKYFGLERNGRKVTHYRGHTQNCQPILDQVKRDAAAAPGKFERKGELQKIGSIPRVMVEDWLKDRGKTWHDYATDSDLKRAFTLFMHAERPAFFLKAYQ